MVSTVNMGKMIKYQVILLKYNITFTDVRKNNMDYLTLCFYFKKINKLRCKEKLSVILLTSIF